MSPIEQAPTATAVASGTAEKVAIDRLFSILDAVAGRLDRNLGVHIAVSSLALAYLIAPGIIPSLEPALKLPVVVLRFVIPGLLVKLFIEWATDSYHFLLARMRLERYLRDYLAAVGWPAAKTENYIETCMPPSLFTYLYEPIGPERKLRAAAHLLFLGAIIGIVALGSLLSLSIAYYQFPVTYHFNRVAAAVLGLVYPVFYALNYAAMTGAFKEDPNYARSYRRVFVLILTINIIVVALGFWLIHISRLGGLAGRP